MDVREWGWEGSHARVNMLVSESARAGGNACMHWGACMCVCVYVVCVCARARVRGCVCVCVSTRQALEERSLYFIGRVRSFFCGCGCGCPGRARGDRLGGIIRNSYSGVMAADWLGLAGDGPFGRQDVAVNEWDEQYVPGDSAHEWALGAPGAGPGSSSARPTAPALSTAAPSNPRPTARPTTAAPTLYPSRHPTFFLPDQLFLPDKKEQEPYLPTQNKQEFDACGRWWSRAVGCGADPGPGVAIGPCCSGFRCQEEVCIFDDLSNNWSGDYGGNLQDSIVGQFNNRAGGAPVLTSSDQISDTIQLYSTDIATLDEEFPSAGHDGGHLIAKHYDALVRFEIPYEVEGNEIVSSVLELQRYDSSEGFLVTVHSTMRTSH